MPELDFTFLKELRKPNNRGRRVVNLIGREFERLTPLGFLGLYKHQARWLCQCKCGGFSITQAAKMLSGHTRSCGCLADENRQTGSITHGQSKTRVFRLWADMKTRGGNPNYKQAERYSKRGITVCEGFQKFENFLELLGQPPSSKHEVDRKDNDKGYWCGRCAECAALSRTLNVRWADDFTQAQNKSNNRLITAGNETLVLAEWARRTGLSGECIAQRLDNGESPEEAVDLIFKERKHQSRAFREARKAFHGKQLG